MLRGCGCTGDGVGDVVQAQTQHLSKWSGGSAAGQGTVLDGIVAVVNGEVILESDVDEDQRIVRFSLSRDASGVRASGRFKG